MRYDVALVPFPFDDLTGQKVRPAVCLTEPIGPHRQVAVAFVSSVVPSVLEASDLPLTPGTPDFSTTGLRVASILRLHRIATVSTKLIVNRLGVLAPALQVDVARRLRALFAV